MPPKIKTVQNFNYELAHALFKRCKFNLRLVAKALGMPYQTLIFILKGRRAPMRCVVTNIAMLLNVEENYLLRANSAPMSTIEKE